MHYVNVNMCVCGGVGVRVHTILLELDDFAADVSHITKKFSSHHHILTYTCCTGGKRKTKEREKDFKRKGGMDEGIGVSRYFEDTCNIVVECHCLFESKACTSNSLIFWGCILIELLAEGWMRRFIPLSCLCALHIKLPPALG